MNCLSMQNLLRRRLQDPAGAVDGTNWSRDELIELLNLGLAKTQKAIMRVSPDAFVAIDAMNIELNKEFYQKPDGCWKIREVRYRASASEPYRTMKKLDSIDQPVSTSTGGTISWADFGDYIAVRPVPTAQIVQGLQWIFVPNISVSADTDVPRIHIGLHALPVYMAQRIAIGETGELAEARTEVNELIQGELADIPDYYQVGGQNDYLVPEINH